MKSTRPEGISPDVWERAKPRLRSVYRHFGTLAAVAKAARTSKQAIYKWVDVPPLKALALERASKGALSRHDLAPRLYPRPHRIAPR